MAADWRKIRTEYVTGRESYRQLAKRHGLPVSTLSKVAKKEGWPERRRQYGDKVAAKTEDAMCARTCARELKRLEALQRAAVGISDVLAGVLDDPGQFTRYIVSGGDDGMVERTFKKVDMRAIKDFTVALQTATRTVRDLYGLPGYTDAMAMELAIQRLALDRQKAELGTPDEDDTGIVVLAMLEDTEDGEDDMGAAGEAGEISGEA